MSNRILAALSGLVLGIALAAPASATVIYNLGVEQSSYSIVPGQTLDVNVYLYESLTMPADNSLLLVDPLSTAYLQVGLTGTGTNTIVGSTGTAEFFNLATSFDELDLLGASSGSVINSPANTVRRVLLGSFQVLGGGGVNQLDFSLASGFFTLSGVDISPTIGGAIPNIAQPFVNPSASFTAVPEPTSGILFIFAAGLVGATYRHREKAATS